MRTYCTQSLDVVTKLMNNTSLLRVTTCFKLNTLIHFTFSPLFIKVGRVDKIWSTALSFLYFMLGLKFQIAKTNVFWLSNDKVLRVVYRLALLNIYTSCGLRRFGISFQTWYKVVQVLQETSLFIGALCTPLFNPFWDF